MGGSFSTVTVSRGSWGSVLSCLTGFTVVIHVRFVTTVVTCLVKGALLNPMNNFFTTLVKCFFKHKPSLSHTVSINVVTNVTIGLVTFFLVPFFIVTVVSSLLCLTGSTLFPGGGRRAGAGSCGNNCSSDKDASGNRPLVSRRHRGLFLTATSTVVTGVTGTSNHVSRARVGATRHIFQGVKLSPGGHRFYVRRFETTGGSDFAVFSCTDGCARMRPGAGLQMVLCSVA